MSQILVNLYIASVDETFHDDALKTNATHFLNVASELNILDRVHHSYHKIGIADDDEHSDIRDILIPCITWIHDALHHAKSVVCVHCLEGKSRSVCVCIAYLCKYHKMTFADALDLVTTKRPCVDIFPLYKDQLKSWLDAHIFSL